MVTFLYTFYIFSVSLLNSPSLDVLALVIRQCVEGADVADICIYGDKMIMEFVNIHYFLFTQIQISLTLFNLIQLIQFLLFRFQKSMLGRKAKFRRKELHFLRALA
jgi:hypothetical protein